MNLMQETSESFCTQNDFAILILSILYQIILLPCRPYCVLLLCLNQSDIGAGLLKDDFRLDQGLVQFEVCYEPMSPGLEKGTLSMSKLLPQKSFIFNAVLVNW